MANNGTCSVKDCENPARYKGMCNAHYQQVNKHGRVTGPVRPTRFTPCSIDDCGRPVQGSGLCGAHIKRAKAYGNPTLTAAGVRGLRTEKACSWCAVVKPLSEFAKHPRNADGRQAYCSECHNRKQRESWPNRRESNAVRLAEWRKTPAGIDARKREYQKGRDRAIARATAWAKAHPDKMREYTRRRRTRLAVPKGSRGGVSRRQIKARWDYFGGHCWMCGAAATQTDHVKPVARGGANIPANLRPACGPCNRAKSDRWPIDTSTRALRLAA